MTSPRQRAERVSPLCRQRTPTARRPSKMHALNQTTGFEPDVATLERRLEKSARRRPAPPPLLVDVEGAATLVVAGVEVLNRFDAGLRRGGAERVKQIPAHARRLNEQFAIGAVFVGVAEEMIFVALEIRQHIVPAPAGEPELAPMIIVGRLPPHVDHGVDRRRAADRLAARIVERPAVKARHRFGLEAPIRARIADGEQITDWNVEPDPVVRAAGFEHEHAAFRVGGQPIGQQTPGRTRSHDHVVVFAVDRLRLRHSSPCLPSPLFPPLDAR